jgi:hypothetical protein
MLRHVASWLLVLPLLAPTIAGAQDDDFPEMEVVPTGGGDDGSLGVDIVRIEDRTQERFQSLEGARLAINRRECARDIEITFWITNFPVGEASFLDLWRGTSANCADPEIRESEIRQDCVRLSIDEEQEFNQRDRQNFVVRASELVDCDVEQVSEYDIWFLATAGGEFAPAASYKKKVVTVRTRPPPPPANVTARNGENSLAIAWESTGADQNLRFYQTFVDWSGCGAQDLVPPPPAPDAAVPDADVEDLDAGFDAGIDAASPDEDAGTDAPPEDEPGDGDEIIQAVPPGYVELICDTSSRTIIPMPEGMECAGGPIDIAANSRTLNIPEGFEIGDRAALAVVAVDRALNPSEPVIVCAERVETYGICDVAGRCPNTGCSLGVVGGGTGPTAPAASFMFLLAALGLLYLRRRPR